MPTKPASLLAKLNLRLRLAAALLPLALVAVPAIARPYENGRFVGRIAYSSDGNHNDPDDWAASPVTLTIFAEAGLRDRLVHYDYNSILPLTEPDWERKHADSVLGAAQRYGYDRALFFDCQRDLAGALASTVRAINASSASDPLYFIIAGPMEVPYRALVQADQSKLQYVYCISHSRWNDGFASNYKFTFTKRSVIAQDVHWIQIPDQNRLLSFSRYGAPATPAEFAPYFWMRDSRDSRVQFLWERMLVSTRPDPSDAGMAWFLATGDEECDPAKLKRLLADHQPPSRATVRPRVRIEAENFRHLEGFVVDDRHDRAVSHRLNLRLDGVTTGRIRTRFDELFTETAGRYDIEIRTFDEKGATSRFVFLLNGRPRGEPWSTTGAGRGWSSHLIRAIDVKSGDELRLDVEGSSGQVDFIQLNLPGTAVEPPTPVARPRVSNPPAPRPTAIGMLDDPKAMPGGLIVAGANPGYLKYNGGGPVFLSGPDNPEDFLYLGTLNPDGTRSDGEQSAMIARMARAGVNAFHCLIFRMKRCNIKGEGDDQHSPFVDHDPGKPLNEAVLAQWEGWLTEFERAGINVHFEFYNDATDVERMGWALDANGDLHPDERRFIAGVVERFKHHKNILWGIEESSNKLPRARVAHFKKIGALIAQIDNYRHPIVQSFVVPNDPEGDFPPDGVTTDDYAGDPNIRVITWLHVVPHGKDYERQHQEYLLYARKDRRRFVAMKNETFHHPRAGEQSRRYMWSCAMTGLHTLEAYHHADGPRAASHETLRDDALISRFMAQTDFYAMYTQDELAAGSTNWVLANPGVSYIAYSYAANEAMGLNDLPAGRYDLLWFDPTSGRQISQKSVSSKAGTATWLKPPGFDHEVALYIKRTASGAGADAGSTDAHPGPSLRPR